MRTGIQQLNAENEAARFDEALTGFFRVGRAARRGRGMMVVDAEETVAPDGHLRQIKRLLRDAEASTQTRYIQRLYAMVLHQLQRSNKSPVVFARALELSREVFKRSAAFRALVAAQTASFFDRLLVAAGEDPRANVSRALRARTRGSEQLTAVLALVETWKQDFGHRYPALVAGHAVLAERGYVFPHERERRQEQQRRGADTIRRRQRVSHAKKQQRDREMKQLVPEMEQVLVEMNRAFEILVPTLDLFGLQERVDEEQLMPSSDANPAVKSERKQRETLSGDNNHEHADKNDDDDDNVEWEDVSAPSIVGTEGQDEEEGVEWENVPTDVDDTRLDEQNDVDEDGDTVDPEMDINEIVQTYGLGSSSYQLTVEVSKQVCEKSLENDALFGNLADGALRMRKRFLPLLDDWEQHSTLTGPPASSLSTLEFQREVLQTIRDLRDRMTRALLKWDDLAQGSKKAKHKREPAASAVVKLPLDAYDPPAKRQRQISS